MNSYERILEMIDDLKTESEKMNGALSLEGSKRMLILSECVTAGLQAFLFKQI